MSQQKRLAAVAGVACAIATAGPIAAAGAASPAPVGSTNLLLPLHVPTLPVPLLSCSGNNGLLPGITNLGPTGPLGLLGRQVPPDVSKHRPCRIGVFMK
jgi:hypothetical protein